MKITLTSLIAISILWLTSCGANIENDNKTAVSNAIQTADGSSAPVESIQGSVSGTPSKLTKDDFLTKVYDYEKNPDQWVYAGNKPCIIDFYADWCKPCKMVAPILSQLAGKYGEQIIVYKVNVDEERELAQLFGIRSIPTFLYCPMIDQPQMLQGALPQETLEKAINELLLGNNNLK
jgi:thioredoxin